MERVCNVLLEKGIIDESDIAIVEYGLKGGITFIINIITMLVIGAIMNSIAEVLIFTMFLIMLRSYTGGYHCNTKGGCYCLSSVVTVISANSERISRWLSYDIAVIIWAVSVIVIYLIGPIDCKNKPFEDDNEIRYYTRISHCLIGLQVCAIIAINLFLTKSMVYAAGLSTVVIAISLILGLCKNLVEN